MKIETIVTYRNETDGLEAVVMDGNDKFNYRVVFRDTDARKNGSCNTRPTRNI